MTNRKKLIEDIMASLHAMRNKMQVKAVPPGDRECVTHSQLFVLAIIEQHNDIGIKEVSNRLGISSSAATQLVDGLVTHGYVIRKASASDRRALHLELSAKGRKHITGLKNRYLATIAALFDTLDDEELKTYLALHKKILSI